MGHQPFVTRLVLGRSAFQAPEESSSIDQALIHEVKLGSEQNSQFNAQQYDRQGHPQNLVSKELIRQSRRAQNEVLAAIGVCVPVDKHGKPIPKSDENDPEPRNAVKAISKENDCGLFLATVDWALFCLADLCLLGLRQRMQTFSFYSRLPFSTTVRSEWKHFGPLKFLCAGTLATVLFRHLNSFGSQVLRGIYNRLTRRFVWRVQDPDRKYYIREFVDILEVVLKAVTLAMIVPIEMFATLQRLDLVPAWPPLPSLRRGHFSAMFKPSLLLGPGSRNTLAGLASSISTSPLIMVWILSRVREKVDERLFLYIRLALPKPSEPDLDSIEAAALEDLNNSHILGLGSRSARQQLTKDIDNVYTKVGSLGAMFIHSWPMSCMRWRYGNKSISAGRDPEPQNPSQEQLFSHHLRSDDPGDIPDVHVLQSAPELNLDIPQNAQALDTLTMGSPSAVEPGPELQSLFASDANEDGPISATFLENEGPAIYTKSTKEINQRHHVTALTAHMADTLAMHFSTHLADLLFLPLEALFVRSVAISFLSPTSQTASLGQIARWRSQVFPLQTWFAQSTGPGGIRNYVTNLALCGLCEVGVGMGIWQLSSGLAWLVGRKWFGWGTF